MRENLSSTCWKGIFRATTLALMSRRDSGWCLCPFSRCLVLFWWEKRRPFSRERPEQCLLAAAIWEIELCGNPCAHVFRTLNTQRAGADQLSSLAYINNNQSRCRLSLDVTVVVCSPHTLCWQLELLLRVSSELIGVRKRPSVQRSPIYFCRFLFSHLAMIIDSRPFFCLPDFSNLAKLPVESIGSYEMGMFIDASRNGCEGVFF